MIEELKARIAELKRQQAVLGGALNHTAQYIAWREFGECRGFDAAIATPAQVIEIARAALAAVKPSAYVPPKPNHQVQSLIEAARCLGVAQAKGDHTQHWESAVADLSVALNAAAKPAGQEGGEQPDADRSFAPEYEVWQDDIMVASASGHRPDAIREILHYAAQYQQDGPVQIFEVRRQLCSAEELVFAQNGLTEAKKADVMINGLTEAETTASASVAGLMGGA